MQIDASDVSKTRNQVVLLVGTNDMLAHCIADKAAKFFENCLITAKEKFPFSRVGAQTIRTSLCPFRQFQFQCV